MPTKLTVVELSNLRSPTVILFEELGRGSGRFHLLVGLSPTTAHLVDGGYITRHQLKMPIDRFRRGWTGFALVPRPRSPWLERGFGAALGAVASVVGVRLAHTVARVRQR